MWLFSPISAKNHFLWLTLIRCHWVGQRAYMRQPAVTPHPPSHTAWCCWHIHAWTGPFTGWRLLVSMATPGVEAISKLWINTSPWDHHPLLLKFQICWHRKDLFFFFFHKGIHPVTWMSPLSHCPDSQPQALLLQTAQPHCQVTLQADSQFSALAPPHSTALFWHWCFPHTSSPLKLLYVCSFILVVLACIAQVEFYYYILQIRFLPAW